MTKPLGRTIPRCAAAVAVLLYIATPILFAQDKSAIKVHGHWTIDVRNPDGSLASHNEFENALVANGATLLSGLLAHNGNTALGWVVYLDGGGIAEPIVAQSVPAVLFNFASTNLTVATQAGGQLVLQGSLQAGATTTVSTVTSDLFFQRADGSLGGGGEFSQRTLSQPISAQAGQIIQVTVVFSFS
jgi:hypothetical protein